MKQHLQKALSLGFALGFLLAVIGVPVSEHYCGHVLVSTSVGLDVQDPCGEMPMAAGCCEDVTTFYSVTDYFNNPPNLELTTNLSLLVIPDYSISVIKRISLDDYSLIAEHGPPLIEPKIFVRFQSFRL